MARARRIIPALLVLVILLLILGWFWLPSPDLKALGSQSAYSISFFSNFHFWRSAGYFDGAAHEKWLLHTWSLSVEWQFYILFPIFLILIWKLNPSRHSLKWSLFILFLGSLAISTLFTPSHAVAAFYLLPSRAWEMAAGGLVFFWSSSHRFSDRQYLIFQLVGWPLLIGSFVIFSGNFAWPGAWALLPVIGTTLILLSNNQANLLTSHPIAQWLGDRSYSIYLWHWPLVVALIFIGIEISLLSILGLTLFSLLLGDISYRLIEQPARRFLTTQGPAREIFAFVTIIIVLGVTAASFRSVDFDHRLPHEVVLAAAESLNYNSTRSQCFTEASGSSSPGCIYGSSQEVGAILIGDSHAMSVVSAFGEAAHKHNLGVLFWGMSSCPTMKGFLRAKESKKHVNTCKEFNEWAFNELSNYNSSVPVVLVSRTSAYLMGPNETNRVDEIKSPDFFFTQEYALRSNPEFQQEFKDVLVSTACKIAATRDVYLVRPTPEMVIDVPKILSRNILLRRDYSDITISREIYRERNSLVWQAQDEATKKCGVHILNPLPHLCNDEVCYGSRNSRPLYFDDDHLSEYGNRYLIPMFEEVFKKHSKRSYF